MLVLRGFTDFSDFSSFLPFYSFHELVKAPLPPKVIHDTLLKGTFNRKKLW